MSTFHAVVWIDQAEAHVVMFDREHMEAQRIKSRTHHKHQGKADDSAAFFADVARALNGTHEVLLTGPGGLLTDEAKALPGVAVEIVPSLGRAIRPFRDARALVELVRLLRRRRPSKRNSMIH